MKITGLEIELRFSVTDLDKVLKILEKKADNIGRTYYIDICLCQ
jgi:hypothetical protein